MWRRNSKTKEILKFLALGTGVAVFSTLNPTLPHRLLEAYFKQRRFQRNRFLQDLRRLQARELIDFRELEDGTTRITLKRRGQKVALAYRLEDLEIKKPKRWDGEWRLVMFDIPHSRKRARDLLREKLRELGFYQLQKSVFIFPYPCEDEIDFLGELLDIRRHILILPTSDFEGAEKLKHYYGLPV